jgi:diacylglycerol kinase family enzyme
VSWLGCGILRASEWTVDSSNMSRAVEISGDGTDGMVLKGMWGSGHTPTETTCEDLGLLPCGRARGVAVECVVERPKHLSAREWVVHGRCDRSGMSGRGHKLEVNVSDPSPTVIDIHAVEIENSVGSAST